MPDPATPEPVGVTLPPWAVEKVRALIARAEDQATPVEAQREALWQLVGTLDFFVNPGADS